ncbi:MAG: RNA 2',3'-cyclic phosphodiesterase [Chloroflexota bacterium]
MTAEPADERRLFVALPLPDALRDDVTALVERVRARATEAAPEQREVRWVRLDGLHLTLRFLGPTDGSRLPALAEAIRRAGAGGRPIPIRITGAGAFPSMTRPRTLWLGVDDAAGSIASLAETVERELVAAGSPPAGRPFRPHLTLARSDGVRAGASTASLLQAEAAAFDRSGTADRLVLFESMTGHGRARYEPLEVVPLG